jgi:hypothetical protein
MRSRLSAVASTPVPRALVSSRPVPRAGAPLAPHLRGVDGADDREAVLGLGVLDGVAARDGDARLARDVVAAREDLPEELHPERLRREAHEVERDEGHPPWRRRRRGRWSAAMRPKSARVVDHRREEVGGEHQRELVGQAHHRGVVGRGEADDHVGVDHQGQRAQDLREIRRADLARSPGAVRELREADLCWTSTWSARRGRPWR